MVPGASVDLFPGAWEKQGWHVTRADTESACFSLTETEDMEAEPRRTAGTGHQASGRQGQRSVPRPWSQGPGARLASSSPGRRQGPAGAGGAPGRSWEGGRLTASRWAGGLHLGGGYLPHQAHDEGVKSPATPCPPVPQARSLVSTTDTKSHHSRKPIPPCLFRGHQHRAPTALTT